MFGPTDKFAIFGKSGCGKSTMQELIASAYPRQVVIDYLAEHTSGDLITTSLEQFANFLSIALADGRPTFKVVLQFSEDDSADKKEIIFDEAIKLAYKFGKFSGRGVFLSVEEVQFFAGPMHVPHWLNSAILTGRHANLAVAISSQRPASVHKVLVSQASHVFVGQLFEMRDLEYLDKTIGAFAYRARDLKQGDFIHYRPGEQGEPRIVSNLK